jgi:hypothetical protein
VPEDGGSDADPEEFELELVNETVTKRVFKNRNITFSDATNVLDMLYRASITLYNENGETLDHAEFRIEGFEDTTPIKINTPSLKVNEDGETFTFKVAATGNMAQAIESVKIVLTPDDGGSDADPKEFSLEFVRESINKRVFNARKVQFIDPRNVIDMEYKAVVTLYDTNGEELDYAEFRIVGLE